MSQKIMTHVVRPDGTIIEVHDHGRGLPNGVATLNAQGTLEQSFASELIYANNYPSPDGIGNLVSWIYAQFTA